MSKIPEFHSLEEEAAFWDRQDITEVEDELEPIEWEVVPPKPTFSLRLDSRTGEVVRDLATRRGVRPTQLMREWIEQRVAQEVRGESPLREVMREEVRRAVHDELDQAGLTNP